jgi:hypothetical protein
MGVQPLPHGQGCGIGGALIFLVVFVSCFLTWKAIGSLRNRRKSDAVAVEARPPKAPEANWDQTISSALADHRIGVVHWIGLGCLEGTTQREQEEFLSTYAPRKVRKAMKQRQKAREQAQKHESES